MTTIAMTPLPNPSRDIEAIREAAEKATDGPWLLIETHSSVDYERILEGDAGEDDEPICEYLTGWQDIGTDEDSPPIVIVPGFRNDLTMTQTSEEDNAAFITAANPQAVLSLIAHLKAAEAENEQLRLAICGGEDAPGYAASLPLQAVLDVQRDNFAVSRSALERLWAAEAREAELIARCDALVGAVRRFMPITTRDNQDYAEVTFGEHQSQAMTMAPDDWNALNDAFTALTTITTGGGADV